MLGFTFGPPALHALRLRLAFQRGPVAAFWATVTFAMLSTVKHLKVLWAIVVALAVDVVDVLTGLQFSAQHFLHHEAMLADVAIIAEVDEHITVIRIMSWPLTSAASVMPSDEAPSCSVVDSGQLPASTSAGLRLGVLASVMASQEALALLISKIRAPFDSFAAAAPTERRFETMPPQQEGRAISKQMLFRNGLLTAART